ncbi:MAG: S9 family peptidase [Candidatus Riflebacteria bacterium]|nr:S9 family peptidase [Candidatus Riflebacteria bacterium]
MWRAVWPIAILSLRMGPPVLADGGRDLESTVSTMARVGRAFSPSFSPDGRRVAFVADLSGSPQVWIIPSAGGWPTQVTAGDDPVESVTWSPAGDWLAFVQAPGGGVNTQVHVVRPDGTGLRRLTEGGRETNDLADWTPDGRKLRTGSNRRKASAIDAYLTDPVTGASELVVASDGIASLEGVSRDGYRALLNRMVNRSDNNLYLVDLRTRLETLLTPHSGPGSFTGKLSEDGRTVYLSSNKDRDLLAFSRVRLSDRGAPAPPEVLAQRPDAELDWFEIDAQGARAALLWNVAGKSELAFVDLASGRVSPGPRLPAEIARAPRFSRDGKLLALTAYGAVAPPDIWVLEIDRGEFRRLTESPHAGVDLAGLTRPELARFKAHDGLELTGWLYRPRGRKGPAPWVLSFHGGPEGQERPTFRGDYQALVARGIGVLAPNIRGSTGFGKRFANLDNGPLRRDAIEDLRSSVEYLVGSGVADPKRIGIMGGSYGGYMTMIGLTEFPDLFAAGVNLFGIVNFFSFFEHTEPWMAAISTVKYGDPKTQADMLRSLSPLFKLDRVEAALMVQHGANDTNVPVVEAEQVVESLERRGVPVEYLLFPDEGHGFRKITNKVRSTVALVDFFTRHLGLDRGAGR